MKNFLLTLFLLPVFAISEAQIQGPLNGSTFTTVNIPGSGQTWTNASNVSASDNIYATFGNLPNPAGAFTDYLVVTGFGFSVPPGATISGIVVEVERSDPNGRTADNSIRIVKNGVISASEYGNSATYSFSDNSQSFGNAGELWGESWTAADINSPSFGIAISAKRSVSSGTTGGRIDNIRIAVFFDFITLPVDLLLFRGGRKNNVVQLSWITANEENMDYYEVQRSDNGSTYTGINRVNSQNRTFTTSYSVNDTKPSGAKTWYRLKMMEKTGVVKYSNIIAVAAEAQADANALYPNPLPRNGILLIKNPSGEQLAINIYNNFGHQLAQTTTNSSIVTLNEQVKNNSGILYYRVTNRNGQVTASGKLLIQ